VKLTFEGTDNGLAAWTPNGRSVTYTSNVSGSYALWTKRADGSAQSTLQLQYNEGVQRGVWSPDGQWLVVQTHKHPGDMDLAAVRPGSDAAPKPILGPPRFRGTAQALSPDGRWLAYISDESGQAEVYVVPFPDVSQTRWAVSSHGGTEPAWSHNGTELFYKDGSFNLVAVQVRTTPTFSPGATTPLFPAAKFASGIVMAQYAVARDAQRFLMLRPVVGTTPDKLFIVENWFEELRAKFRK
jgi:Tol biopolymer transport system component